MKKKRYKYENFTTCTELLSEVKNAKKMQKIFWEHFQNIFRKSANIDDFQKYQKFQMAKIK